MSDSRRNAGHSQAQWGVKWFTRQGGRRKRFGERKHVLVRITKIYVTAVTSPRPSKPFLRVSCFRVSTRRSDIFQREVEVVLPLRAGVLVGLSQVMVMCGKNRHDSFGYHHLFGVINVDSGVI